MLPHCGKQGLCCFLVIFAIFSTSLANAAVEYQIGVSPPVIDLGVIETETIYTVRFNIVTPSQDPLLVYLKPERGTFDFFSNDKYAGFMQEYSEEDASGWVRFVDNPVQLSVSDNPQSVSGQNLGWREVAFLLQVPSNAEPGYHTVKINPTPSVPQELSEGAGSRIVAINSVIVIFKVPGYAVREGIILDVVQSDYLGTDLGVKTYFENTGSVTITAVGTQTFSKNTTTWQTSRSQSLPIKPGQVGVLNTQMSAVGAALGDYNVSTTVSYTTGKASRVSTVTISEPPRQVVEQQKAEESNFWLIIVAVVAVIVISILIYKWYQ